MHVPHLIEHKRDGGTLDDREIRRLIEGFTAGTVPDYQMSALAMAVYFRGMDDRETATLTAAMRDSGRVFEWPEGTPPKVDKHSTGGVGDKVSLVLAPLLACDDVWVPMVSGRGLGITGGTLDKLESITGFNVNPTHANSLAQLEKIGVVMLGQAADFCPADKKLYALRDVSGTVPSAPLIVASIMSKKLAESLDRLVLDVKFGSGAFMKTREDGRALAERLVSAGTENGVETTYVLTPMEEPLGRTVGNALEVREAVETLRGEGGDLRELVLDLAVKVSRAGRARLESWLSDGTALAKFEAMVTAQGGNPAQFEDWTRFHPAPLQRALPAPCDGTVTAVKADAIGRASVRLGGGRERSDDKVDFAVGFSGIRKTGERVARGEPLLTVHARSENTLEMVWASIEDAVEVEPC